MKSDCRCLADKIATIAVAEYDKNNQLEVFHIEVCENCKKMYEDIGLVLSDDQIEKYVG